MTISLHRHAVLLDALDDRQRAEGRGLDQRPVDLVRLGVQRLAQQQAAQAHIDQDRAVAVVPVQRQQAVLAGLLRGRRLGQVHELLVLRRAVAVGNQMVHEPEEDVAHGRLAGLDAVVVRAGWSRRRCRRRPGCRPAPCRSA